MAATITTEETTTQEKTELTRQKLADARVEAQVAQTELVNFGSNVSRLIDEQKAVESATEEAETHRSDAIGQGDESEITKSRKKLMSLKIRAEEIQESLPLIRGQYNRRERELAGKRKEVHQLERNLWLRISDELRENQPPQLIEFFEKLYAAALLGIGENVQLNSLLTGLFPRGVSKDRIKACQDELRREFDF